MKEEIEMLEDNAMELTKSYCLNLQNKICEALEEIDAKAKFSEDSWDRPMGGGGLTRILNSGRVFSRVGVNFSYIKGEELPASASCSREGLAGCKFSAVGISLVVHPENPYVPTSHFNLRFFIVERANSAPVWWFGGGFDLTPYYGFHEDCRHWHQTAYDACKPFGANIYSRFKNWCDSYFYLKHRKEARGIGGLFFDDYNEAGFSTSFSLARSIGNHFIMAYAPIVKRRFLIPYGAREKEFQCYRRGRYVEFNLLYDRGTIFGLQSDGRVESILMSLPPEVHWRYNWSPLKGSPEEKLYSDFLPVKDWL